MLKFIGSIGAGTLLVLLMACKKQGVREVTGGRTLVTVEDSLLLPDSIWNRGWLLTESEQKMKQYGLVDVQRIDPTIRVHLQYADSSNFMGERLYADLHRAYLLPAAAQALSAAQQELKKYIPARA